MIKLQNKKIVSIILLNEGMLYQTTINRITCNFYRLSNNKNITND